MAYFDNANAYYYPAAPLEGLDQCPFLQGQTSTTTKEVYNQAKPTFASGLSIADQPRPSTPPPASSFATTGYGEQICDVFIDLCLMRKFAEPAPPTFDPHLAFSHAFGWPTPSHFTQPNDLGTFGRESFPTSGQELGTVVPTLTLNASEYHYGL
jgi:hypothetical protein